MGIWANASEQKRLEWSNFDSAPGLFQMKQKLEKPELITAEEIFAEWRARVERRGIREKQFYCFKRALDELLEEGQITRREYEVGIDEHTRSSLLADNVAWLLTAESFFKHLGLETILFSESPYIPDRVLDMVHLMRKRIPLDVLASHSKPLSNSASWKNFHEILEQPVVWLIPRVHLDRALTRDMFVPANSKIVRENWEILKDKVRKLGNNERVKQREPFMRQIFANMMSVVVISNNHKNPIREFCCPFPAHPLTRHQLGCGQSWHPVAKVGIDFLFYLN